jgi:hypothetical protein
MYIYAIRREGTARYHREVDGAAACRARWRVSTPRVSTTPPDGLLPCRYCFAWTVERHGGRSVDHWRNVCSNDQTTATNRFDQEAARTVRGTVRLRDPFGKIVRISKPT